MKSLIYGYNKCYILSESFPLGEFLRRGYMYKEYGNDEPYTIFWESADNLKNEWAPIKQGMFGGRYENYKTISEKANAYYKQGIKLTVASSLGVSLAVYAIITFVPGI